MEVDTNHGGPRAHTVHFPKMRPTSGVVKDYISSKKYDEAGRNISSRRKEEAGRSNAGYGLREPLVFISLLNPMTTFQSLGRPVACGTP